MNKSQVVFCPHCDERNEATRSYCRICFKALVLPDKVSPTKKCVNILKELMNDFKEICLYPQFKKLWQYAVFRWCVYQTPLLVFGLLLKYGEFGRKFIDVPYDEIERQLKISGTAISRYVEKVPYGLGRSYVPDDLSRFSVLIWILVFTLPTIWVWRKPIWKAISFLNKKAEED